MVQFERIDIDPAPTRLRYPRGLDDLADHVAILEGRPARLAIGDGLEEITGLEIPTGQPIVYELDGELNATERYYLSER